MDSLPFHLLEEILFKLDPKSLAMMQCSDKTIKTHVSDDPYFKSKHLSRIGSGFLDKVKMKYWNVAAYDGESLVVREKEEPYNRVVHMYDLGANKRFSSLNMITRLIGGISPYALKMLNLKKTLLGKRFIGEENATSKFLNVERINKRRRVK